VPNNVCIFRTRITSIISNINKMREGGTTGAATLITGKVFETIFSVTL
jgi:hypothetical protein